MNQNLNVDQLFQNHIFDINQHENTQIYEKLILLAMELQCERKRSQYIQSINEKNIDFIEKKRLTSQREMNDHLLQTEQQVNTLNDTITEKNQQLYEQKQNIQNLIQENQNLERGIENYKKEIVDQNRESTAVNILNLENQRLQDNLRFERSQFEVQKIKLEKQNYELFTENQQLKDQYKNLTFEYQKLRIHFENEQILSKKFQLQLEKFKSTDIKENYEQLKEKYDDIKNQNNVLKEMISKNLNNKNHSIDQQFDNIEDLKNKIIELKNENFELKINSLRNNKTQRTSAPENFIRPKKKEDKEFQLENLSVSQEHEEDQYTPKSFYKMPTNPLRPPKQYQNIQKYLDDKQKDVQDLNNKDMQFDQKKIFQLKRLKELVNFQVEQSQNAEDQNQKLFQLIKNLDNIKNIDSNIDAQLLLQYKQKQLDLENQKIEYVKNLNNMCVQQLQFLKSKNKQIDHYQNEFNKISQKTTNSLIQKPTHEEIIQQKEFLRRITQNYKTEYNEFLQLDKKSEKVLLQQNKEEINIQKAFNDIDQQKLTQFEIVDSFRQEFQKHQRQKKTYYDIFEIWIQNEKEIQQLSQKINQQELQLSMKENSYIENNHKNLFNNPNQTDQSVNVNKLSRSLHPQEMHEQYQPKFNQTIGNNDNHKLKQIQSIQGSEQDPLEIFQAKKHQNQGQRVTFQNQPQLLDLQDSYFESDKKQTPMDYSFSTKRENDDILNVIAEDNNENNISQNDSSQQIIKSEQNQNQSFNPKFVQTKNTEFFSDELQSNYPSNKTNPIDPYQRYNVDDQQNQNNDLKYQDQGSKRSYKSDFSRQFSNIGGLGNKKNNLVRQTTVNYQTTQNTKQYQQQSYQQKYSESYHNQNQQQNNWQDNNPYKVQQQIQQQTQEKDQTKEIHSLKDQLKIQNQVLLGIIKNLNRTSVEIDYLPQVILDINNENEKLKKDIKFAEFQYQEALKQIQYLQVEKEEILKNLHAKSSKQIQQNQQERLDPNDLYNYKDVFSGTKIQEEYNSQNKRTENTQNIQQNINSTKQTTKSIYEQQNTNLSRTQKVQVTQLQEENDYLLQKIQSERKRNFGVNGQDKINNLEDLLSQYEQQLTKQKQKIILLQRQLQQEKDSKIEIEKLYQEQISKKNTEIIQYSNQIQTLKNKIKVSYENESTILNKDRNGQKQDLDYELLLEKNQRLQKKIKDMQQQMTNGTSQTILYQGRNMDYYINLISKLKQENKELKSENLELDQTKRDNLYLKSQLEIYKDSNSNKNITTHISYQNKSRIN